MALNGAMGTAFQLIINKKFPKISKSGEKVRKEATFLVKIRAFCSCFSSSY